MPSIPFLHFILPFLPVSVHCSQVVFQGIWVNAVSLPQQERWHLQPADTFSGL